mgnify:CR=1 FL=1
MQEIVFDPVSLRCGHMFCYSCVCSAASVSSVEGLRFADKKAKCPLCREVRSHSSKNFVSKIVSPVFLNFAVNVLM